MGGEGLAVLCSDALAGAPTRRDHPSDLLSACRQGRTTVRALQLFDVMRQLGLHLNVITYRKVISAWG